MKHIKLFTFLTLCVLPLMSVFAEVRKDGDIRFEGSISQISPDSMVVGADEFALTSQTEYEDANGRDVSLSFFSVGDLVKVKAVNLDGILTAREIEIEVHGGDNDSKDEGSKNGSGSSKKKEVEKIRLRTKLAGEAAAAKGYARRKARIRGDRSRDRIRIKVNVPIPSTNPALGSEVEAESLVLKALFSREGVPYASCDLEFDEVEQKVIGPVAEYKTDIRVRIRQGRDDRLRVKKGSCDTDISTDAVDQGVPQVSSGDSIEVLEVTGSGENSFLSGSF